MAYRITLKPSGHTYEAEEGKNVLQAGLDAGRMLPYSCRAGVCRTCRGTLLEGRVDYGAIGTVTNLASRLCQEAQAGEILISQRVRSEANGLRHHLTFRRAETTAAALITQVVRQVEVHDLAVVEPDAARREDVSRESRALVQVLARAAAPMEVTRHLPLAPSR